MPATAKAQPNIALIKYWGKRDVERKLEKLERKTQRAMIELTREEDARRMAEQAQN